MVLEASKPINIFTLNTGGEVLLACIFFITFRSVHYTQRELKMGYLTMPHLRVWK
jgi:hypothetical protein